MLYYYLAAGLVILHALFVCFVVIGGVLCIKWRKLIWLHIPAVIWGIFIELSGWICPLTPLENYFRHKAGISVYSDDFISHYLIPILYPESLTRQIQILLAITVLIINIVVYTYLVRQHLLMNKFSNQNKQQ